MGQVRVAAGVALVLAIVAASTPDFRKSLRIWRLARSPDWVDEVTLSDRNCARIRDQLPPKGRVGFRDQAPSPVRHAITQYSLVPLIVEPDPALPVVVERVGETGVRVAPPGGR